MKGCIENLTYVLTSLIIISFIFGFLFKFLFDASIKNVMSPVYVKENFNDLKKNKSLTTNTNNFKKIYLEIVNSDFEFSNEIMKITIELDFKNTPKTANNFYQLCKNNNYSNCPFHRVIKNFMIQGGDITNHDGTGGQSFYGNSFEDENFMNKHNLPGIISMANSGKDTNTSQFFITLEPSSHLDGKHVAFGKVTHGMDYIRKIGNVATDHMDRPIHNVYIKSSYVDH